MLIQDDIQSGLFHNSEEQKRASIFLYIQKRKMDAIAALKRSDFEGARTIRDELFALKERAMMENRLDIVSCIERNPFQ